MPGKHAPESPRSFYLSVARTAGAVAAGLILLVIIIMAATGSKAPKASPTPSPSPSASVTVSQTPSETPNSRSPSSSSPSPSPKASPSRLPRKDVTVYVLNQNGRGGLAGKVANQLQADGWTNVDVANQSILAKTRIGYKPEALLAARELHDAHPELGPIQEEADTPLGKMLVVRLGKDYPG